MHARTIVGVSATVLLVMVAALIALQWQTRQDRSAQRLVVYCAAGMQGPVQDAIDEYQRYYQQQHGRAVRIDVEYAGSGTLLSRLQVERTGDLYLAGDDSFIDTARQRGLVDESLPLAAMTPVIALAEGWMRRRTDRLVPAFLLLTALSCLTVFPPAFHMAAGTDIHLLLVDMSEWPALLAAGGLAFLPFFLLAMVLGLVFIRDTETIGRRYGANLVGSACGGGLALVLLLFFHPEETLPLFCCLTAAGAVIPPVTEKRNRSKRIYAALSSVLFLAGLAVCANAPPLPLSP